MSSLFYALDRTYEALEKSRVPAVAAEPTEEQMIDAQVHNDAAEREEEDCG